MKSLTTMPRRTSRPGLARQLGIGFDARRDHHQIGFEFFARSEPQPVHPAVAEQRLGLFRKHHPDAQALDLALQICAAVASSWRSINVSIR